MSNQPTIYTAGKMDWEDSEDSYWRKSVELGLDSVEWLHPTDTYFDHGGDTVGGCVAEDMGMIERADGVVGVISHDIQVGTVTELVHAANRDKPLLAIFTDEVAHLPQLESDSSVFTRSGSEHYWFLINYLVGDGIGSRPRDAPIDEWPGFDDVSVRAASIQETEQLVREWIDEQF